MLRLEQIEMSFSGVRVLEDARLDLRAGETHILAGENGAGKSTLIKIIAGVHTGYKGRMFLDEKPVRFKSPQEAAARGIAVIHQELSLIRPLSVRDNLFLGLRRPPPPRRANELLEALGLDLDPRRAVEEFPLAIQQLIEIAKAMAREARILIMDEPTSALAETEAERLFGLIAALRAQGRGILYISHRLEEIYRLGDRITILRDGRWAGTEAAADLPRGELIRRMVGRELSRQFPARDPRPGAPRLEVRGFCVDAEPGSRASPVRDAAFTVRAGEILGIAGLQGSGASDLLMGLFGARGRRARGEVAVDGVWRRPSSPRAAIACGLALLPPDRKAAGLILPMSVLRNLTLAALRAFSPGGWLRPAAEAAAAEAHRSALAIKLRSAGQPVESLSGGNQQKVALAKWLETRPRVLLLDEPTRGVDVGAKHDIYERMNRWTREGLAVVLITSEMPELLAMSDRILVMCRGRIRAEFSRAEATQERILAAAMGGGEAVPP